MRNPFQALSQNSALRSKLILTIILLFVARAFFAVRVPGVDSQAAAAVLLQGGLMNLVDLFGGGALSSFSILALGVTPYINASIVIQLLTVVFPRLDELQKEGKDGQKKVKQYTYTLAAVLAMVQGLGLGYTLYSHGATTVKSGYAPFLVAACLTVGSAILITIGELVTKKGIGNGTSLIIFANIISRLPQTVQAQIQLVQAGAVHWFQLGLMAVVLLLFVAAIVFVTGGERRIPVEYARRARGTGGAQKERSVLPIKVNHSGVMSVIFAQSLLFLPQTAANFWPDTAFANGVTWFMASPWFWVADFALTVFFTYFAEAITFKPYEVAETMQKNGGYVPGFRPGNPTADYLAGVASRLIPAGALFLAALTISPILMNKAMGQNTAYLGGTALLIVVGVANDTVKQAQALLIYRRAGSFIKAKTVS